ncbi:MAG TPA: hypothetical protein VMU47_06770 [Caldimonas sp.]|nr:hypothetical protein [Caldimonas sp.]
MVGAKQKPLSAEMHAAIDLMMRTDGSLYRYPGGMWATERGKNWGGDAFGTPTVKALIARGICSWSDWKVGPLGRFPVRATLASKLDATVAPIFHQRQ